jgi:hypothetical protein
MTSTTTVRTGRSPSAARFAGAQPERRATAFRYARLAPLLPLLFSLACDRATDPGSPAILDIGLPQSDLLVQPMRVTLAEPAPLEVEYWTEGGPRLRVRSSPSRTHHLALTRLRPGRSYSYTIAGRRASGVFQTAELPEDLAQVRFTATGTPTVPLVLVHLFLPSGFKGYAVIDESGSVVWYYRTQDFPFGMTRRANGNFVLMDKGRGLLEVTPAGDVTHMVAQDLDDRELHHDVIATPANTLLFIAHEPREVDGRRIKGDAIWEWSPEAGTVVRRWSSWDHLSLDADRGPRFGVEWMHANSLSLGPRQNVVLSVHFFDQVLSISPDWQRIEWRLGGVNATVTVPDDQAFSGQHTARELAPGRILLFDNGLQRAGPSRAVEFEVTGARAEPRWSWSSPTSNYSSAVSSARRLPNGNTLVAFGVSEGLDGSTGPTEAYEVTPDGHTIWHVGVTGTWIMFRAEPMESIGAEETIGSVR